MRTSAAVAPCSDANTGFRSISEICGKSAIKRRHALDHARKRRAVDRLRAAHSAQNLCRSYAIQHRQRVLLGGGREAKGNVLQNLHQDAAQPKGNQLAESRVGDCPNDDLLTTGQHLLHLDAKDLSARVVVPRIGGERCKPSRRLLHGFDSDEYSAGFGLVQDLRRDDLHDDREANLRRELASFLGTLCHALLRNTDSIGLADSARLRRGQSRAPRRLRLIENSANGVLVCYLGCLHCSVHFKSPS